MENNIIYVKLQKGDPRVCDYCNKDLVDGDGTVVEESYLTDYGLMCKSCKGSIEPWKGYSKNVNVKNERWYKEGIDEDNTFKSD